MRPSARRTRFAGLFGRQVLREVAQQVALAMAAAVALFMTIDSVEAVNRALSRATLGDMARLQLFNMPTVLQEFAVLTALIGTMSAVGALLRRGEVVAVLAAGGSPSSIVGPALLAGLTLAALHASVTEWVVPTARAEVSAARRRLGLPAASDDALDTRRAWFRGADHIFRVSAIEDSRGEALGGVLILRIEDGRVRERWDVERLRYEEARWVGEGILHRRFSGEDTLETTRLEREVMAIDEIPSDFVSRIGAPGRLPLRALVNAAEARNRLGQPSAEHEIELYRRAGQPLALFVLVVFAAAFALRLGRRPTIAACLGVGALFGFGLWFVDEVALALGTAGAVSPALSAGLMPVVAAGLAAWAWWAAVRRGISAR